MSPILHWGIELITALQNFQSPLLTGIALGFTALGEEMFFLFFLPLLYWCFSPTLGVRVGLFFLISNYLNTDLKDLLRQPRPFDLVPALRLARVEGFGLPSGHAQSAVVVWGTVAASLRRAWLWPAAAVLALLIGISRVYLGVHFPTDVLAGWAIGGLLLAAFLFFGERAERWLAGLHPGVQIALAAGLSGLMLLMHSTPDTVSVAGTLGGFGIGLALARKHMHLEGNATWKQRTLRLLVGMTVLGLLYFGLKRCFPADSYRYYQVFRFIRYTVVGFWVSFGAPWLFRRVKLAGTVAER